MWTGSPRSTLQIDRQALPAGRKTGRKDDVVRLNYYLFPEDTPVSAMVAEGCEGIREDGRKIHWWQAEAISDWSGIKVEDRSLGGITVSAAKKLLKQYGGSAWTEHCERDGGCFEVTEIKLQGNNSRFKYNHHL